MIWLITESKENLLFGVSRLYYLQHLKYLLKTVFNLLLQKLLHKFCVNLKAQFINYKLKTTLLMENIHKITNG